MGDPLAVPAPAPIDDHVLPAFSADPAVRAACARQAAEDWHEFVAFRGRELVPEAGWWC